MKEERDAAISERDGFSAKLDSQSANHTEALSTLESEHKAKLDGLHSETEATNSVKDGEIATLKADIESMKERLDAAAKKEESLEQLLETIKKDHAQAGAHGEAADQRVSHNSPKNMSSPGIGITKWAPPSPFPAERSPPFSRSHEHFPSQSLQHHSRDEISNFFHHASGMDSTHSQEAGDLNGNDAEKYEFSAPSAYDGIVRQPLHFSSP